MNEIQRDEKAWDHMLAGITEVKLAAGLMLFLPGQKRDVPDNVRDINLLMDQTLAIRKQKKESDGEKGIFVDAFKGNEEDALKALSAFLRDVRTCPKRVIDFCQHTVNPRRSAA